MKKKTLKSIVLTAVMVMALSMSACGSKEADAPADTNEVEDTTGTEDESQTEPEAEPEAEPEVEAETSDNKTVEDYYNEPEVKAAFEEQIAAAAGQGMSISIEVKGNDFAMIYQYDPDFVLADDAAEQLDTALESNASVFETQAQVFDAAIGQDGACTVIVQYLDAEGNLLTEKSFKAQ